MSIGRQCVSIAFAIVLAAFGSQSTAGAASGGQSEDMLRYAVEHGMTIDEVQTMFAGQDAFSRVVEQVRAIEPDNFAWAKWRSTPKSAPVILFAGTPGSAVASALSVLPYAVDVVVGTKLSEQSLIGASADFAAALSARLPRQHFAVWPSYVGVVPTIELTMSSADPEIAGAISKLISEWRSRYPGIEFLAHDAEIKPVDAAVNGGGNIGTDICTAAFTLTTGASKGISTAAHCNDWTSDYLGNAITFGAASSVSQGDVQ